MVSRVRGSLTALFVCLAAGLSASRSQPAPDSGPDTARVARDFASLRTGQIEELARGAGVEVPTAIGDVLNAFKRYDWPAVTNLWPVMRDASGQYEDSDPNARGSAAFDLLWTPLIEMYGYLEQVYLWQPDLLRLYARELLAQLPPGCVYFGGTDPGRFVITACVDTREKPDVFVITQNALADGRYLAALRRQYGDRLWVPGTNDLTQAFQTYVKEVSDGIRPRNADLKVENGRVQVSGAMGVMEINGILARQIFDRNRTNHAFFVEESYLIPWMHPHLEPCGPLMKLNPEPVELKDAMIARDRDYWDRLAKRLQGDRQFLKDAVARKTFSKLRCAIAGLYAYHKRYDEAEAAFRQAIALCPDGPEGCYRLTDMFLKQERYAEARAVMEAFRAVASKEDRSRVGDFLQYIGRLEEESRKNDIGVSP
jgi:hypothetical protein